MESGTLRQLTPVPTIPIQRVGDVTVRPTADHSTPDEPTAVLVVGAHDSGKRALTRALLGGAEQIAEVHPATYLVMRHGAAGTPSAYVPGCRQPQRYGPGPAEDTLARPPRRVEFTLPDPLLRHFTLVETPCSQRLGTAGGMVLADAAERGGAVVFVVTQSQPMTRAELDLLAELASREIAVFFTITPGGLDDAVTCGLDDAVTCGLDDAAGGPYDDDSPGLALDAHRAAVARHAPALADAPWYAVDPAAGDTAFLRRALAEWAGAEGLRRAGANPPILTGSGTVHVGDEAARSGWSDALDRWLRTSTRVVRQRLAIEVAGIHLRCVQDLVFGGGCAGLSETLDNELHALSLRATAESDAAVAGIVHDLLVRVLASEPTEDIRRRVGVAVRRGLAADTAGRDLGRVLLVTSTGGVATVNGTDALTALAGYASPAGSPILPAVGLAVSGGCYVLWRIPTNAEIGKARSWLQRVTRAVELELLREVRRRFEAVHRSLGGLIGETIDHGILLA